MGEAFVVAWGGTAAQAGRLTGLLILSLELKKLAIRRKEIYIFWVLLLILLGEHAENSRPIRADFFSRPCLRQQRDRRWHSPVRNLRAVSHPCLTRWYSPVSPLHISLCYRRQ